MFINCKKSVLLNINGSNLFLPAGYLGEVPGEVNENWYFKALCQDGTITFCESKKDSAIDKAQAEAEAREAAKQAEQEKKRLIDEAKQKAKTEAEKEAEENGLDKTAEKKLIAAKQKTAVEALLAELGTPQE